MDHLIEIATRKEEEFSRNRLVQNSKIGKFRRYMAKNKDTEFFRSHWAYHPYAEKYLEKNKTLIGYNKAHYLYPKAVIIDFDLKANPSKNLSDWVSEAELFLYGFNKFIYDNKRIKYRCVLFFSGTGFHLHLDKNLFSFNPLENLPNIVGAAVANWWHHCGMALYEDAGFDYDKSLFTSSSLYRAVGSINSKSGFYKTLIERPEIATPQSILHQSESQSFDDAKYEDLADDNPLSKWQINPESVPGANNTNEEKKITDQGKPDREGSFAKVGDAIHKILMTGPEQTCSTDGRHNIVARLASWMRRQYLPEHVAKIAIHGWFDCDNYSYDHRDTDRLIENIYQEAYFYGPNDDLIQKYCRQDKDYGLKSKNKTPLCNSTLKNRSSKYNNVLTISKQDGI